MDRRRMDYADSMLLLAADTFNDVEAMRIAASNRLAALVRDAGITEGVEVDQARELLSMMEVLEHEAELALKRTLRRHYLGAWVKQTTGIGEKQGARLIGAIGNPRWNYAEDRPRRGPAELWAYCGYHVISGEAPRRRRGERANWNSQAKMRAFLCAESAMKQMTSPYRPVYDAARAKHAEAVHSAPCVRCGPSGRPAAPGSPLSDGHAHARALREVAKAILRDLFVATPVPDDVAVAAAA